MTRCLKRVLPKSCREGERRCKLTKLLSKVIVGVFRMPLVQNFLSTIVVAVVRIDGYKMFGAFCWFGMQLIVLLTHLASPHELFDIFDRFFIPALIVWIVQRWFFFQAQTVWTLQSYFCHCLLGGECWEGPLKSLFHVLELCGRIWRVFTIPVTKLTLWLHLQYAGWWINDLKGWLGLDDWNCKNLY